MITTNSRAISLRPGDAEFSFSPDGIIMISRAAIEISDRCPEIHRYMIAECVQRGWIKPVAFMRDTEYTVELLRQ